MKQAVRAVIFSLFCIVIFSITYNILGANHFKNLKTNYDKDIEYIDYLFLATTLQAGVGYSNIYPITDTAKTILIIQQLIMITTYVFVLYFFTL